MGMEYAKGKDVDSQDYAKMSKKRESSKRCIISLRPLGTGV